MAIADKNALYYKAIVKRSIDHRAISHDMVGDVGIYRL
jgi:hypothetical protein